MEVLVSFDFPPKIGGAHHWMYEQYRRWPSDVRVVTAEYSSEPGQREREQAFDRQVHGALTICRIAPVRDINVLDARYWLTALRQIRIIAGRASGRISHLHAVRAFPEGFTAMLSRRTLARGARLITYAHGEEILVARTSRQLTRVARSVYASSDLVIVNSEGTRQLVADLCPSARMVRISPGVDAASYLVPEHEVRRQRRQWGWPDETVVIVTVARMERRKNHAMLLESVAALRSRGLPVAYVCGGDGEERSRLEELCRARNLQPWVRFTGAVTDEEKRLTFAAGQIHAMPSIQVGPMIEGFGIVFIEAAAAGLPSLAGNTGGQAEAVLHGETGFVVDGTSLTDVCDALERLVSDPGLRTRMGARGRQWAAENDWARITQKAHSAISGLDQTS